MKNCYEIQPDLGVCCSTWTSTPLCCCSRKWSTGLYILDMAGLRAVIGRVEVERDSERERAERVEVERDFERERAERAEVGRRQAEEALAEERARRRELEERLRRLQE